MLACKGDVEGTLMCEAPPFCTISVLCLHGNCRSFDVRLFLRSPAYLHSGMTQPFRFPRSSSFTHSPLARLICMWHACQRPLVRPATGLQVSASVQ